MTTADKDVASKERSRDTYHRRIAAARAKYPWFNGMRVRVLRGKFAGQCGSVMQRHHGRPCHDTVKLDAQRGTVKILAGECADSFAIVHAAILPPVLTPVTQRRRLRAMWQMTWSRGHASDKRSTGCQKKQERLPRWSSLSAERRRIKITQPTMWWLATG